MFDPVVWGTVAAWVSAVGTTGSVGVAAGYYIFSQYTSRRAQAMMVAVQTDDRTGSLAVEIRNNSAATIYDLQLALVKRKLKDVVTDPAHGTPFDESLPEIRDEWRDAPGILPLYLDEGTGKLATGEQVKKVFEGVSMSRHYMLVLTFMDANSFHWEMEIASYSDKQRHRLRRVKYFLGVFKKDDDWHMTFNQWRAYRVGRWKRARWARRNSQELNTSNRQ
jgi:hypothetical protein